MTVLVGILCADGVIIASDSAATFGTGHMSTIGQQVAKKVHVLASSMIFAATGAVGMSQLIADKLTTGWNGGEFKGCATAEQLMGKLGAAISQTVTPFLQSGFQLQGIVGNANGSLCKSLVAVPFKGAPCLFQFDYNGAPERCTAQLPFVSLGSGQLIADPFLAFLKRLIWNNCEPTIAEGKLVSVWVIDHVCKTNPGGVGGDIQLMVLGKDGKIVPLQDTECAEHKQQAAGAEAALVQYLRPQAVEAPPMPVPPVGGTTTPAAPAAAATPTGVAVKAPETSDQKPV